MESDPPPPSYTLHAIDTKPQSRPKIRSLLDPIEATTIRNNNERTIIFKNRAMFDGYRIFLSEDACEKYETFKVGCYNRTIDKLMQQGFCIPIFNVVAPYMSNDGPFLSFKRYVPTMNHEFDIDKDYFEFCTVKQKRYVDYITYTFKFMPNPNDKTSDFTIFMISHPRYAIHDYIYRDERHRWFYEVSEFKVNNSSGLKHDLKHTILNWNQPSLIENRNIYKDKLNIKIKDLFIGRDSFGGISNGDVLSDYNYYYSGKKKTSLTIGNFHWLNSSVDCGSVLSLTNDELVTICVAAVLKRDKDLQEISKIKPIKNKKNKIKQVYQVLEKKKR